MNSDDLNRQRQYFIRNLIQAARKKGQQLKYIRRIHEKDLSQDHRNNLNRLKCCVVGDEFAIEFHEFEFETEEYIIPMIHQWRVRIIRNKNT